MFEVHFKGKNAFEAGQPVPQGNGELGAWKPTESDMYACTEGEARKRRASLVEAGIEGREVDGVVPHVVTVEKVEYVKRRKHQDLVRVVETVLWQYAEPDAIPEGPWASEATS